MKTGFQNSKVQKLKRRSKKSRCCKAKDAAVNFSSLYDRVHFPHAYCLLLLFFSRLLVRSTVLCAYISRFFFVFRLPHVPFLPHPSSSQPAPFLRAPEEGGTPASRAPGAWRSQTPELVPRLVWRGAAVKETFPGLPDECPKARIEMLTRVLHRQMVPATEASQPGTSPMFRAIPLRFEAMLTACHASSHCPARNRDLINATVHRSSQA